MAELVFENAAAVPEDFKGTEKPQVVDGKETGRVIVNAVPRARLDEFRENNVNLAKERDSIKNQLAGFTGVLNGIKPEEFPTHYSELTGIAKKVKDGELVASDGLEKAVDTRTKQMRSEYDGRIGSLETDRDTWKGKYQEIDNKFRRSVVDRAITNAVLAKESGARPEALPDILSRAYGVFQVDDSGNLKAVDHNGNVIYGSDGSTPMAPAEWISKLKDGAPYFFQGSGGGGAGGGTGAGGGSLTPEQIGNLPMDQYRKLRKGDTK